MKRIYFIFLSVLMSPVFAQELREKEIKTEVNEVTVFIDGAQVVRKKTVHLERGVYRIKFVDLSPFIDAKSVQVKAEGNIMVLSVNHQNDYLNKLKKPENLVQLEKQLESLNEKINLENTYLSIIADELAFLHENRVIGGKNEPVSLLNMQQTADYYGKKLNDLKLQEIEKNRLLKNYYQEQANLQNQINTLSSVKEFPTGQILVKTDAKTSGDFSFELSYVVANAGWFPTYDIRAKNLNEPVQLIYKANVKQDTKVDWNNVKLKFSSSNPNVSGVAPQLQTYFLDYYTAPPKYKTLKPNQVSGRVTGSNWEPLPGANVVVTGTTIGTVTDYNGNYSITIPNNVSYLTFSYIGYNSISLPITGSVVNANMQESMLALDEVVVMDYEDDKPRFSASESRASGAAKSVSGIKIRGTSSLSVPTAQVENQTTVDFEIKTPYTIKSDNKNFTVDMEVYELPAMYQYYCVPKIDKDAFLLAQIVDWEKYNLLEGEANLFFEETYVGKTLLDVRNASDTLEISLGRDKKVSVKREKIKDFTTKQFIGNKKEESRAWKTTVKNNKNQSIHMIVLDQVPVSTLEEIEVLVREISGAKRNTETGEIKWELLLDAGQTKELNLNYVVKYPKTRSLIIE